ncbi:hypothetical protein HID58_049691 [Brassica napus]|uniref:Histone-lysine N-methyltransferase n=1 Tax=Brassica napus TaxID=3708 RepID=A0ABQ8B5X7_BRANA|nr:hypothetical protein HID58_049691 [Brassica napus]
MVVSRRRRTQVTNLRSMADDSDSELDTVCEECSSGKQPAKLLLCDKCDKGFHLFCLRPILVSVPKGSWFCPSCSKHQNLKAFPLVQTKLLDFFRIKRSSSDASYISCSPPDNIGKKRKRTSLVMSKKKRKLLPYNPTVDPQRRLEQMASLATALRASNTEFSNKLTYVHSKALRSANKAVLEKGGMQNMMVRGECPPLMVVFDPYEGFTVEADRCIKDLTIITEYVGDVDYLSNRENNYDGDSMMTLLHASDPSQCLVICPDKRSNIARFISGINNHTPEGRKKQNLKCVRFNINGEARVLLVANRDISKGERLYYDYNGYEHEYPTENFQTLRPKFRSPLVILCPKEGGCRLYNPEKDMVYVAKSDLSGYQFLGNSREVLFLYTRAYEPASGKPRIFRLYKRDAKDLDPGTLDTWLVKVDSIGDEALFFDLGITVPADHTLGIEPSSIYFTRNDRRFSHTKRLTTCIDVCVYKLATKTIKRVPGLSSNFRLKVAMWFLPS